MMAQPQFRRSNHSQNIEDDQTHNMPTKRDSVAEQETASLPVFYKTAAISPYQNEDAQMHCPPTNRESVADQDTAPLPALRRSTSAAPHEVAGNLSVAVQRMISTGLSRLQDPQPEGLFTRGLQAVKPGTNILGLLPILTLTSTFGVLIVSFSYYIAQYGNPGFELFFLLGLLLIFAPNLVRLLSPAPSRFERICLLCVVGMCFYLVQLMISPLHFASFDEFLHWRTADDILRTRHLFSENSMLPVSPYYPGLEIVTNASSAISGLSTFQASIFVIIAARLLMTLSLFMFYEQVTKSSRMAGIATMIYMANPQFIAFDAIFSYETLALSLATFLLYILARNETVNKEYRWMLLTAWITILAVSITHHMTDYVLNGLLIFWAVVSMFQISARNVRSNLVTIAFFGILVSLAYAFLLRGNPVWGYLSSYFKTAIDELWQIIVGTQAARPLFNRAGVEPSPIWDRLLMISSVAIIAFGLPFGLFSLWQQHRHHALALMLGIASLVYPIAQIFRFTNFGSEISDRSTAFIFLAIAYVLTIFITHFWPSRRLSWRATSLITFAISIMLLGGTIIEAGPSYVDLPGPYKVVADGRSVEPEGIQDASWTLSHLGSDNWIGTDRINQMLTSTFGDQRVVTQLYDNVDISPVFFSSQFGPEEVAVLRRAKVRYLVVDLRLSTALPVIGFYFESGQYGSYNLTSPISRESLTKFNAVPQIKRVFDSGNIVIYDMGTLVDGSSH